MAPSRARTSASLYRRCQPRVRMLVSLPLLAHLVTVLGSTLNMTATSPGVSRASGGRAVPVIALRLFVVVGQRASRHRAAAAIGHRGRAVITLSADVPVSGTSGCPGSRLITGTVRVAGITVRRPPSSEATQFVRIRAAKADVWVKVASVEQAAIGVTRALRDWRRGNDAHRRGRHMTTDVSTAVPSESGSWHARLETEVLAD